MDGLDRPRPAHFCLLLRGRLEIQRSGGLQLGNSDGSFLTAVDRLLRRHWPLRGSLNCAGSSHNSGGVCDVADCAIQFPPRAEAPWHGRCARGRGGAASPLAFRRLPLAPRCLGAGRRPAGPSSGNRQHCIGHFPRCLRWCGTGRAHATFLCNLRCAFGGSVIRRLGSSCVDSTAA